MRKKKAKAAASAKKMNAVQMKKKKAKAAASAKKKKATQQKPKVPRKRRKSQGCI